MAESGAAALDQLAQKSYQLMLLDIKMPGMDGVEVLQKAREDFPDLAVVMMTAYATVETAVEAMKIGALDYLMKPFDPESLIPMVERMYEDLVAAEGHQIEVGAVVLCGGTSFFDPAGGKNTFGYGIYPNVVTNLEFGSAVLRTSLHSDVHVADDLDSGDEGVQGRQTHLEDVLHHPVDSVAYPNLFIMRFDVDIAGA